VKPSEAVFLDDLGECVVLALDLLGLRPIAQKSEGSFRSWTEDHPFALPNAISRADSCNRSTHRPVQASYYGTWTRPWVGLAGRIAQAIEIVK
jgi:hypothetical protein